MKLGDYLEAPPLDCVGTKSPPITDAERGASFVQILEQSVETRISVPGTSVILKGLLARHSGNTANGSLMSVRRLRVKPTNLKVEDDGTLDDSMLLLPPSQARDDALSDE